MSILSTLVSAFKGGGGKPPLARAPGVTLGAMPQLCDGGPHERAFDYAAAVRRGYLGNPIAQRAVRIVAEGVGGAPLGDCPPALCALVEAESAGQSLAETLAAHLLLHGNGYVRIVKDAAGAPVELFALRPDRMSVIAGADGWPVAYAYRVGGETHEIPVEDDAGWPGIVHLKAFHPADDHYGAGALAAADQAIAVHEAAGRWNRALLENGARPSGALVLGDADATMTADQFERIRAELASAYAGAGNAGRPMLLEGGLDFKPMSLSPADMDFAALKEAAARDIALAFGVPPMLLGLPGDSTYANYREANRALWRLTLLPLADKILGGLGRALRPWFPDAALAVDLDRVPALAEDRERLWAQVSAADFLSDTEKRAVLGLRLENIS